MELLYLFYFALLLQRSITSNLFFGKQIPFKIDLSYGSCSPELTPVENNPLASREEVL